MKPAFIYCLWCPIKRRIRYIGKTVSPHSRFYMHIHFAKHGKHQYVSRWVRGLMSKGKMPKFRVLYRVPDGERWQDHETRMISRCLASGRDLVNTTAGGEGYTMLTAEQREQHRKAVRDSYSPEMRRKRSIAAKARWADPEYKTRVTASMKAMAGRPENRARVSKLQRSPAGEARRLAGLRRYNETRQKTQNTRSS